MIPIFFSVPDIFYIGFILISSIVFFYIFFTKRLYIEVLILFLLLIILFFKPYIIYKKKINKIKKRVIFVDNSKSIGYFGNEFKKKLNDFLNKNSKFLDILPKKIDFSENKTNIFENISKLSESYDEIYVITDGFDNFSKKYSKNLSAELYYFLPDFKIKGDVSVYVDKKNKLYPGKNNFYFKVFSSFEDELDVNIMVRLDEKIIFNRSVKVLKGENMFFVPLNLTNNFIGNLKIIVKSNKNEMYLDNNIYRDTIKTEVPDKRVLFISKNPGNNFWMMKHLFYKFKDVMLEFYIDYPEFSNDLNLSNNYNAILIFLDREDFSENVYSIIKKYNKSNIFIIPDDTRLRWKNNPELGFMFSDFESVNENISINSINKKFWPYWVFEKIKYENMPTFNGYFRINMLKDAENILSYGKKPILSLILDENRNIFLAHISELFKIKSNFYYNRNIYESLFYSIIMYLLKKNNELFEVNKIISKNNIILFIKPLIKNTVPMIKAGNNRENMHVVKVIKKGDFYITRFPLDNSKVEISIPDTDYKKIINLKDEKRHLSELSRIGFNKNWIYNFNSEKICPFNFKTNIYDKKNNKLIFIKKLYNLSENIYIYICIIFLFTIYLYNDYNKR